MSFNLTNFIRRTPRQKLEEYFRFRSIGIAANFNWAAPSKHYLAQLRSDVENLTDEVRERVYQDLEYVSILSDESGQLAIRSLFGGKLAFMKAIESMENSEARSLTALIEDEATFRNALAARLADRLHTGRSWSGFLIAGGVSIQPTSNALAVFQDDLRSIFKKLDGSGRKLSIETFDRDSPRVPRRITQYSVFVEGLPQASNEFEADRLVPRARRPVFEAALCHDSSAGTIDVVCKGGRNVRFSFARAFATRMFGIGSDLRTIKPRHVNLSRLKSRMEFPTDQSDGVRSVIVSVLRLADIDGDFGRITLEIGGSSDDEDIWTRSGKWFGESNPLKRAGWFVTQARLRIEFYPDKEGGPIKNLSVDLRTPHGTNLKDLPRRHSAVIEKCLLHWGLLLDGGT